MICVGFKRTCVGFWVGKFQLKKPQFRLDFILFFKVLRLKGKILLKSTTLTGSEGLGDLGRFLVNVEIVLRLKLHPT